MNLILVGIMKQRYKSQLKFGNVIPCIFLYALSVVVSLLVMHYLQGPLDPKFLDADEVYYYTEAKNIVDGSDTIEAYRPIGHVLILALAMFLSNSNVFGMQLIISLISCLRTPLTYLIVKRITHHTQVSVFAAVCVAFWPSHVFYSTSIYSETTALPMFLLFLYSLPGAGPVHFSRWILSGILLGLCILIHPMYLFFLPFAFLIIALESQQFLRSLKPMMILGCSALLTVAPWSIFASLQHKSLVLISTNGAKALAGGINPYLIETGYREVYAPDGRKTWSGPGMWTHKHGYLTREEEKLPPAERNSVLLKKTLQWMKSHPKETLFLQSAKLANMWGIYPFWFSNMKRLVFGNIPVLLLLGLSILAMIKWRDLYRPLSRLWVLPLFVSFVAMFSCGSWRYRHPGDIGVICLAAFFVWFWFVDRTFVPVPEDSFEQKD